MKTSTLLKKSLNLLEENGWTKGPLARNKYRHEVKANSHSAVKFCSLGAICNVLGIDGDSVYGNNDLDNATSALNEATTYWSIVGLNELEDTKFKDVQKVFKKAIKNAKAQGN